MKAKKRKTNSVERVEKKKKKDKNENLRKIFPLVMLILIASGFMLGSLLQPKYVKEETAGEEQKLIYNVAFFEGIEQGLVTKNTDKYGVFTDFSVEVSRMLRNKEEEGIVMAEEGNALLIRNSTDTAKLEESITYVAAECQGSEDFICFVRNQTLLNTTKFFNLYKANQTIEGLDTNLVGIPMEEAIEIVEEKE